jgi:NMD protein affecting ribosome stability and mRNA decay
MTEHEKIVWKYRQLWKDILIQEIIKDCFKEEYKCEKCNNTITWTCCRHCGYVKSEWKNINEMRVWDNQTI